jgi:hypothetical protein
LVTASTFGILRAAGFLARGQGLVLSHSFQSAALVAGHHATSFLGVAPPPVGDLAQQFLHAEIFNLQMGAGLSLLHSLAPALPAAERGLDLSWNHNFKNPLSFAHNLRSVRVAAEGEGSAFPHVLMMSSNDRQNGSDRSSSAPSGETGGPVRLFRKEVSRMIERHIDQYRSRGWGSSPRKAHRGPI